MKRNTIYFLLFVQVFFASCFGQQSKAGSAFIQDKAGNLWFCTTKNGVYRFDGKSFTNFTEYDGLSSNFVWSILEDKNGILWFGTADGISCYDGKNFTNIPVTTLNPGIHYSPTRTDAYGMPGPEENFVLSILQDKTGMLWFGAGNGIYRYNGKVFTRFSHNDSVVNDTGVPIHFVESILEDSTGNIWFGGRGCAGLFRFDGKSLSNFKLDSTMWVRPLLEDKKGNVWFGSPRHMIYQYNGKKFVRFGEKEITDWVFYMAEDKAGNLWFSNNDRVGGVTRYDGKSFTAFAQKDGSCYNSVWCIMADREGNIWFENRNKSLCRFNGKNFTFFSE